jgi:hypothetical protein
LISFSGKNSTPFNDNSSSRHGDSSHILALLTIVKYGGSNGRYGSNIIFIDDGNLSIMMAYS